jgi:signal transduction histidine kinase
MTLAKSKTEEKDLSSYKSINGKSIPVTSKSKQMKMDIPNLKKLLAHHSKELNELEDSNTQFISILAHDLRSPIGSIVTILELLKKSLVEGDEDELELLVNVASESTKRTLNLLDNLLIWSSCQSNRKTFSPENAKFNLYGLIKLEINLYESIALQKKIKIHHSLPEIITTTADPYMIATLVRNLIDNAIKYTNPGGEIFIYFKEKGQNLEVIIQDSGLGMSKECVKNILKADKLKNRSCQQSRGLGLLLCKEIVQKHNGILNLESEIGKGSKFTITLPLFAN